MNLETRIIIENGDVFDGTREQFMDCFFSNADDDKIKDWCIENGWNVLITEDTNEIKEG
jgi:hypothetical protein